MDEKTNGNGITDEMAAAFKRAQAGILCSVYGFDFTPPKEEAAMAASKMKELAPHQQRVVDEKATLDDNLAKLNRFIGGEIWATVDKAEQRRLVRQRTIMYLLQDVLDERIAAF